MLGPSGGQASVEGDLEGVECGFPAVGPALLSLASGVQAHDREEDALQGGRLGGEVAAGVDRPPIPALIDSIAFVVQMIFRISWSNRGKGTNSAQAPVHNRMIAGCLFSHFSLNSAKESNAACSEGAVYTGLRSFAIGAQSFFEAYVNELRSRCTLCRYRHNVHYPGIVVMPIRERSSLVRAVPTLRMSA